MASLLLRLFTAMLALLALASCGARQQSVEDIPRNLEIRDVVVTAADGISPAVLRNTQSQLKKAVNQTIRPVPMPRAVMQVHIAEIKYGRAYDGFTAIAGVNVVLADVESGLMILNRDFAIQAFAFDERSIKNATVEAIVARLRVEYSLRQPEIRQPAVYVPQISTRMRNDEPLLAKHEPVEPVQVVLPLKNAKRVGADADPILNSKTKVDPAKQPAKAVVLPDAELKTDNAIPAANAIEAGANAKVTIKPKAVEAAPADGEPCVETMDKKC